MSVDHLLDNLESGKRLLFWKKTEKSLESVRTLFRKDADAFLFLFKTSMS